MNNSSILTIIFTASVTTLFGFFANLFLERKKQNKMKRSQLKSIITILIADLTAIKNLLIHKRFEINMLNSDMHLFFPSAFSRLPYKNYFFNTFDSQLKNLGLIDNNKLQSNILETYYSIKYLIDVLETSFRENQPTNTLITKQLPNELFPDILKKIDDLLDSLNKYYTTIK
jgi:hypothetical protein